MYTCRYLSMSRYTIVRCIQSLLVHHVNFQTVKYLCNWPYRAHIEHPSDTCNRFLLDHSLFSLSLFSRLLFLSNVRLLDCHQFRQSANIFTVCSRGILDPVVDGMIVRSYYIDSRGVICHGISTICYLFAVRRHLLMYACISFIFRICFSCCVHFEGLTHV